MIKTLDELGYRPTWAEIDLSALAENLHEIRKHVARDVKIMAIVKADAYGHGAVECARRLANEGADWFGVALPEEGIELRDAGITKPILCLAGFWEGQERACLQYGLVPVLYCPEAVAALDRAAQDAGAIADLHVKIDTGMGRLGVRFDDAAEFLLMLKRFRHIRVAGLMTHFAAADDPSCDSLTGDQIKHFEEVSDLFRAHGYEPKYRHLAGSAAIYSQPQAWGNMVRPGGILYGLWRDILREREQEPQLRGVMSLRSRITFLKWVPQGDTIGYGCTFEASRQTLVATLPIGYHDGYLRRLSNRANVIVRDAFAPVVGRISMDLTLIDVTGVAGVKVGDEVTLLGSSRDRTRNRHLQISAEELAGIAGTLSYEVTCGISQRVPRRYIP